MRPVGKRKTSWKDRMKEETQQIVIGKLSPQIDRITFQATRTPRSKFDVQSLKEE